MKYGNIKDYDLLVHINNYPVFKVMLMRISGILQYLQQLHGIQKSLISVGDEVTSIVNIPVCGLLS